MYKYNRTVRNGAEKLIDGIENIEMFLDEEDNWNFHDSEIYSFQWESKTNMFTIVVELNGCDFSRVEDLDDDSTVLLDFHFVGCIEVHMPNVDLMSPYSGPCISEIDISKDRQCLECWFNGIPMRVTSERLRVGKPRIIHQL